MFGGEASFERLKPKGGGESRTTFTLTPDLGYYIIDDLGLGLSVIYSRTNAGILSLDLLAFNPWARYYIYKGLFARAGVQVGSYTIEFDNEEAKSTFSGLDIGAGYSVWLSSSIALEPIVFLNVLNSKDESEEIKQTILGLRLGFQAFLGRE